MKYFLSAILLLFCLLAATPAFAADGKVAWAASAGSSSGDDVGQCIVVLPDRSTIVAGSFVGTATFGSGEANETVLVSAGLEDIFIAKYHPEGTLNWAKRTGGTDSDGGESIALLSDGSFIVAGLFGGTATFGNSSEGGNQVNLTSLGFADAFIARYNPNGTLAWALSFGNTGTDQVLAVCTIPDDSIFATGSFSRTATFGPGEDNETILTAPSTNNEIFVAEYNPNGTLNWAKRAGSSHHEYGYAISALSDGTSYITGHFQDPCTFGPGEGNQTVLTSVAMGDVYIAKYNPGGTLAWAKSAGASNMDWAYGIHAHSDGSAVFTGHFNNTITFGNSAEGGNQTDLTSVGIGDIFIAKYNTDGTLNWAKRAGGASIDRGNDICGLPDGSTIITGYFSAPCTFGLGDGNQTTIETGNGLYLAKYNPDGTLACVSNTGGLSAEEGFGVSVLSDKICVVTGDFYTEAIFGEGEPNETTLVPEGGYDMCVARYNIGELLGPPTALAQKNLGMVDVSNGGTAATPGIVLTATSGDDPEGDDVYFEVEVRLNSENYTRSPTHVSSLVSECSSNTTITISLSNNDYKWRARSRDAGGDISDWVEFNETTPNFTINASPGLSRTQEKFRWYDADDAALAAENAMATVQPGTQLHLRLQVSVSGGAWYLDNQYVILERAEDLNFTANKTEVSSGFWDDLDHAADNTISSSVLTGTTVLQTYIETNPGNPGNQSNVAANGFAEWDFAITAPAEAKLYYYRMRVPGVIDSVSSSAVINVVSTDRLLWAKRAGGADVTFERGEGIAALPDGSAFVTGYFEVGADFNASTTLTSAGSRDIFIAKYNPDGTLNWAKKAGGANIDYGFGISALSDCSAIVVGAFQGTATFGNSTEGGNQVDLTSNGNFDIFIAKYNPDGTLAWAKRAGGTVTDYGYGISALSDGSAVVTGYFQITAAFGNASEGLEIILSSAGTEDVFIAKYNPDGTLAWAKSAGGTENDRGQGITSISDGSAIVTGYFSSNPATFGNSTEGGNQTDLTAVGSFNDIFIAKYNPDGTLNWAKRAGGDGNYYGRGISALPDCSALITGDFAGTATFGNATEGGNEVDLISAGGSNDVYVAKYNPDGTLDWAKRAGGGADDYGYGISALPDGSSFVTGYFYAPSTTFGNASEGGNEITLTSAGSYDIFIAIYNPDGTLDWAESAGGTDQDYGYAVAALSGNSAVVTGHYKSDPVTFGAGETNETIFTLTGNEDIFIARYGLKNSPPGPPSSLEQKDLSDNPISNGGTATTPGVRLSATTGDDPEDDGVYLEIEVRLDSEPYTGNPTHTSDFGAECSANTTVILSLPNGVYKWHARTKDESGAVSSWVDFAAPTPNFTINASPGLSRTQEKFRWYDADDAALAAENAMATVQPGTQLHLRLQAKAIGGIWFANEQHIILEYARDVDFTVDKMEVSGEFWNDIDNAADNTVSSAVLTGTTVLQTYIEANPGNPDNQSNIADGSLAEWDFAVTAPATAGYHYYRFKVSDVIDSVSCAAVLKVEEALPPQGAAVFWVNDCTSVSCTPVNPGNVVGVNDGSNSSCDTKNVSDSWTLTFEDSVGMSDVLNPIDNMTITMYLFTGTLAGVDDYSEFQVWDFNAGAYATAISLAEGDDIDYGAQTTKTMSDSGYTALQYADTWSEVDLFNCNMIKTLAPGADDSCIWSIDAMKLTVYYDELRVVAVLPGQVANFGGSPVMTGNPIDIDKSAGSYTVTLFVVDQDNNARTEINTGTVEIWTAENPNVGLTETWSGGCASFTVGDISPFTGNYVLPISDYPDYPSDTFNITGDPPPVPANFRCTGCSSTTLTWAWADVDGEDGYDIFDNNTDNVVIPGIAQNAETTVEATGLSPNTSYSRYIKAYASTGSLICENCTATTSGYLSSSGIKYSNNVFKVGENTVPSDLTGYVKFDLSSIPGGSSVSDVKFYYYVWVVNGMINAEFNVVKVTSDPVTADAATLISEINSGTVFVANSINHRSQGPDSEVFNSDAYSWIEGLAGGWCAIGLKEMTSCPNQESIFEPWNDVTVSKRPVLEVEYLVSEKAYSNPSNVASAYTLTGTPTGFAFTSRTPSSLSMTCDEPPNYWDGQTAVRFQFVSGGAGGDNSAWLTTTTYTDDGLDQDTTYTYRAIWRNGDGIEDAPTAVLGCRTDTGSVPPPANFRCTDCSSTTLTWAWDDVTGEDGYEVQNSSDAMVAETGADALTTVETGLSPNTTYTRHCHAYTGGGTVTVEIGAGVAPMGYPFFIGLNYARCQILYLQSDIDSAGMITKVRFDQIDSYSVTINNCTIYMDETTDTELSTWAGGANGSGTEVWSGDLTTLAAPGWQEIILDTPFNYSNTKNILVSFRHQDGNKEASPPTWNSTFVVDDVGLFGSNDVTNPPDVIALALHPNIQLVIDNETTAYSDPSNVVETCTAAAVPFMASIPSTFTFENRDTITVRVDLNGNPDGTAVELFVAPDVGDIPGPYTSLGTKNSGYTWDVTGLSAETPYWFKARAQNWVGIWTDNCADTTWSTDGDYTQTLPFKGYHMLWLRRNHGGQTFAELFGDDISGALWIYCWEETTNSWQFVNADSVPQDNCGYIIWAYQADTILGMNGASLDCTGDITINVTCSGDNEVAYWGYNLIRNPFSSDITWSSCDLQNCEATHWRPWNGNQYEWYMNPGSKSTNGSDTIPGGASFWVHAIGENASITIYDPGQPAPISLPPPALQWRMQLSAFTGPYLDTYTYAGVREDALEAYDTYDVVEIRSVNLDYIKAYFDHPGWGRFRGPYTQDTRPFPPVGGTTMWKLTVHATNAAGIVNLSWTIPEVIRDDWRFYIRDDESGVVKDMKRDDVYEYPASGQDTRTFTLTATQLRKLLLGDTNLDGEVTEEDADLCARAGHGLETLTPQQCYVSDLNSDGKVDTFDALLILRRLRGYLPSNP